MTKHNESGETNNKISVEGDLRELKPGDGVNGYEYGSNLETEGVRLVDPAEGRTVSIRVFEFKMNLDPKIRKNFPRDGQILFNAHAKQISTILWGDGLVPLDSVAPRVIINKKKGSYQIFVPCEAKLSTFFTEKPKSLSEQLKNATPRHKK